MAPVGLKSAAYVFRRSVRPPTSTAGAALAFGLFASACNEPIPVSLANPRELDTDEALLDEAFGIFGMEWESTRRLRGTVHITLIGAVDLDEDQQEGTTLILRRCIKTLTSTRDPRVLAHEIGHALGLQHNCETDCSAEDQENLMAATLPHGVELTDEQLDEVEKHRRQLTGCR